jgi:hypothetical protein
MAKKGKKKNNKNTASHPPADSAPPDTENKDLVDNPAPDSAAGAVEDAVQVCLTP